MGNEESQPARPRRNVEVPQNERFSVSIADHHIQNNGPTTYGVHVAPPGDFPAWTVRRRYKEFEGLDEILRLKYCAEMPELPPNVLFGFTDPEFVQQRARGLNAWLQGVLLLEPRPQTKALKNFLGIAQPLRSNEQSLDAEMYMQGMRVPVGIAAIVLSFFPPILSLREYSLICKGFHNGSRHPRCWPSLRFSSGRAEEHVEGLFPLLARVGFSLQLLCLDLSFQNPKLSIALPAGVEFKALRRLTLGLGDDETVALGAEILSCVDAPKLQKIAIQGGFLTTSLIDAVLSAALQAQGQDSNNPASGLVGLSLLWAPNNPGDLLIPEDTAISLQKLIQVVPAVVELTIGVDQHFVRFGLPRKVEPLNPPHVHIPFVQPLMSGFTALPVLQHLTFDFLSDDSLVLLQALPERSWHLQRAHFSGVHRNLQNPEEALSILLSKLGNELEDFMFVVDTDAQMRPFMQGFLRPQLGALLAQWSGRQALRSLVIHWLAFNLEGIRCIVQNCPHLHTLKLQRCEYFVDDSVIAITEGLPMLQHLLLRSSNFMSDQSLYALGEIGPRLMSLEIEPSYSMSSYALDQLKMRINPQAQAEQEFSLGLDLLNPSVGAVSAMAAISGAQNPHAPPAHWVAHGPPGDPNAQRSHSSTLRILKPEEDSPSARNGVIIFDISL